MKNMGTKYTVDEMVPDNVYLLLVIFSCTD